MVLLLKLLVYYYDPSCLVFTALKKAVKKSRIYFYNVFFFSNFQQKMYLLH